MLKKGRLDYKKDLLNSLLDDITRYEFDPGRQCLISAD